MPLAAAVNIPEDIRHSLHFIGQYIFTWKTAAGLEYVHLIDEFMIWPTP